MMQILRFLYFFCCAATCLSLAHKISKRSSICFDRFGCFSTKGHANSLPYSPEILGTDFILKVRGQQTPVTLHAVDSFDTWHQTLAISGFGGAKETKVVIHGFTDNAAKKWVQQMADELLKHGDYNVFLVDWGHGSRATYPQATANSLLVAAQLSLFLNHLSTSQGSNLARVHLIGHSLGAQIAGNAGSKSPGLGRISALDPAQPIFKVDFDDTQRLDKTDAAFVDVIHTDSAPYSLFQGFGLKDPLGHVDFYPNGGTDQPGCADSTITGILGAMEGIADDSMTCSHGRSHRFFLESINSDCQFLAYPCKNWTTYEQGSCHGCPSAGCPRMGFYADKSSARGSYYLTTAESSPYCGHEYFVEMDISDEWVSAYGRLFFDFLGTRNNSGEVEFSRHSQHFHPSDKVKHMLSLNADVGTVTGVKVTFQRGSGFSALGSAHHLTVHRIIIKDVATGNRTTFCTNDLQLDDDFSRTFTSHQGC